MIVRKCNESFKTQTDAQNWKEFEIIVHLQKSKNENQSCNQSKTSGPWQTAD